MRYLPGQIWFCDRSQADPPRHSLRFIILGPGSRPDYKLCRVETVGRESDQDGPFKPFESEYSHKHLKKVAVLVSPAPAGSNEKEDVQ